MLPRDRAPYTAIIDRPPLRLPGEARVAVWSIVNLEVWDIAKPMARQVLPAPTGVPLLPDVPNWSWHEYGMRVGFWRFHKLYDRLGIRPTLSINARVCDDYERVAAAARASERRCNVASRRAERGRQARRERTEADDCEGVENRRTVDRHAIGARDEGEVR